MGRRMYFQGEELVFSSSDLRAWDAGQISRTVVGHARLPTLAHVRADGKLGPYHVPDSKDRAFISRLTAKVPDGTSVVFLPEAYCPRSFF